MAKADKAAKLLSTPGPDNKPVWKEFFMDIPGEGGGPTLLYVGRDLPPKAQAEQSKIKFLKAAIEETLVDSDPDISFAKASATIFINWKAAAKLVAPSRGEWRIEWKQTVLDKFPSLTNFDKAGVKRRFLSLVDAATRQWHSV